MSKKRSDTRRRILEAAGRLFDVEGVRSATIDAIAAEARVTKRTLYYHFRSKDDLIAASLLDQSLVVQRAIDFVGFDTSEGLEDVVKQVFGTVSELTADIRWKGCAFMRAAIELAGLPGHPAVLAARNHKAQIELILCNRLTTLGARDPASSARKIMILLDGAIMQGMVHHDPDYVGEASRMALNIVMSARREGHRVLFPGPALQPVSELDNTALDFALHCGASASLIESLDRIRAG